MEHTDTKLHPQGMQHCSGSSTHCLTVLAPKTLEELESHPDGGSRTHCSLRTH